MGCDGGWIGFLDRWTGRILGAAQWLALPLVVLLFLQWPLRDLIGAWSVEANDLAQILFALYVAASVTAATRAGTHLAADTFAQRYAPRTRDLLRRGVALIGLVPWALFVLVSGRSTIAASVRLMERFSQSFDPGYFIIKLALWVMAGAILVQVIIVIARPLPSDEP